MTIRKLGDRIMAFINLIFIGVIAVFTFLVDDGDIYADGETDSALKSVVDHLSPTFSSLEQTLRGASNICSLATIHPEVKTLSGPIIGQIQSDVMVFKGIPYAAPPIGPLRWHAPLPHASWSIPMKAFNEGSACVQATGIGSKETTGSENCLTMNIWVPANPEPLKAVMVFIHGGFYVEGSSNEKDFKFIRPADGLNLANRGDVIVVSFNYRLGPLGFFASPALEDGTAESRSGNFGLMDQLAALKWVHDNIHSFGGDPSRVTVFGQSAGASSVLTLLASPLSEGLFSKAIVESGYLKAIPHAQALRQSQQLTSAMGCAKASSNKTGECLRALSASQIVSSTPTSALEWGNNLFLPNQDGYVIKEPLEKSYASGNIMKIPVIMGTNANESSTLTGALYGAHQLSDPEIVKTVGKSYGSAEEARAGKYLNHLDKSKVSNHLAQLSTDYIFTCPTISRLRNLSVGGRKHSNNGNPQVWSYVFSHQARFLSQAGAFHGLELPYVFGNIPAPMKIVPSEDKLSQTIEEYWTNFAKNGDPNSLDQPHWPEFDSDRESTLEFSGTKNNTDLLYGYRKSLCSDLDR
jgi:para-nitrobenzyl esterase